MNPYPCENYTKSLHMCSAVVTKYRKRISGHILDRIDIHIEVLMVDYEKLSSDQLGETSARIRARVQAARDIQTKLFQNNSSDIVCNADMRVGELCQFCRMQDDGQSFIRASMSQPGLSVCAYHRKQSVKLARTIVDLVRCEEIQSVQLAEALQYRPELMIG